MKSQKPLYDLRQPFAYGSKVEKVSLIIYKNVETLSVSFDQELRRLKLNDGFMYITL